MVSPTTKGLLMINTGFQMDRSVPCSDCGVRLSEREVAYRDGLPVCKGECS